MSRPEPDISLRVGGFEPLSSLDYPGHLAAVIFFQGCPLRCQYCHNKDLLSVQREGLVSWHAIATHLHTRRGLLDGVVFSGGEPLMQSAVTDAINEVRRLGYSIALHTAGCTPRRLEGVLDQLDWVGLDIKALPDEYGPLTGISAAGNKAWKSLELMIESGIEHEVRTTIWPSLLDPNRLLTIARKLSDTGARRWVLQEARDPVTRLPVDAAAIRDTALHAELAAKFETFEVRRAA